MRAGQLLAGRFEIQSLAETGGMSTVFCASDRATGGRVALKVMSPTANAKRFAAEVAVLEMLKHPGTVRYVAHGTTPDGGNFLAMEWLEGATLESRLLTGPLTLEETLTLGRRVAEALGEAHAHGVVHRDLKPGNLFLPDSGGLERAKILDFGAVRRLGVARTTTEGMVIGTLGYMSPEQVRGKVDVDARSDVFALGCVLHECLTGQPAFMADEPLAMMTKLVLVDPPRLSKLRSGVPEELDELVASMLSKEPAERPADGAAVAKELAMGSPCRRPSTVPPRMLSITPREQQVLSVVLVVGPAIAHAVTLCEERDHDLRDELQGVATAHSASLEVLVDGSCLLTLRGEGHATDQASRSARCALAVRAVLPERRVVLATGRGLVTGGLPVGEVVERAVRLTGMAPADGVRIDEVTAGLVSARFQVRGDESGLVLHDERELAQAPRTLLGRPTRCVGRQDVLRILDVTLDECIAEPKAQVTLLIGPAGVGKSRVRHEFLRAVAERRSSVEVWIARGDAMGAGSPLGLLTQALRRAFGLLEGEPLLVQQSKLRARVGRHVPREELPEVVPFLGELLGVPFADRNRVQLRAAREDAMLMSDRQRRAWELLVEAECRAGPLLLVLEDVHWGDLATIRLVDAALGRARELPFMVLAAARPNVHELFPGLWRERGLHELRLTELTRRASEQLVRESLGARAPQAVVDRILEQGAGNAFYIEELVRAEVEREVSVGPGSVLAMVQGRLEMMEPEARRVLRAASIFGQVFWKGGVATLMGAGSESSTDEWLDALVAREVVAPRAEGRFPAEPEYVFRHALVRDAAYAMLTDEDRSVGHFLAAEWLEAEGEKDPVLLAEHHERGGDGARAAEWYRQAVGQAMEACDGAGVRRNVACAIACGAQGELLGWLKLSEGEAHGWSAEHGPALSCGLEAMHHLRRGSPSWYAAAGLVVNQSVLGGDPREVGAVLGDLLELASTQGVDASWVRAAAEAVSRLLLQGSVDLARPLLEVLGDAEARVAGDPTAEGYLYRCWAVRATREGDTGRAVELWERSVSSFERSGDLRRALTQRVNLGEQYQEMGAYLDGERIVRGALASAQQLGLDIGVHMAKQQLGRILRRLGRLDEARAEASEAARTQPSGRMAGMSRNYFAQVLLDLGDQAGAEREATRAIELLVDAPPARAHALGTLSHVWLSRRDPERALPPAREAMEVLERLGALDEGESLVLLCHAQALHLLGDADGARRAIGMAQERLTQRADKITDQAWRELFLTRIPENAEILSLAARWLETTAALAD